MHKFPEEQCLNAPNLSVSNSAGSERPPSKARARALHLGAWALLIEIARRPSPIPERDAAACDPAV
jgi:hypothetical protein